MLYQRARWLEPGLTHSDYWYYLTDPFQMDWDLQLGFFFAIGTSAVAATVAVFIAAPWGLTEIADRAIEEAANRLLGFEASFP